MQLYEKGLKSHYFGRHCHAYYTLLYYNFFYHLMMIRRIPILQKLRIHAFVCIYNVPVHTQDITKHQNTVPTSTKCCSYKHQHADPSSTNMLILHAPNAVPTSTKCCSFMHQNAVPTSTKMLFLQAPKCCSYKHQHADPTRTKCCSYKHQMLFCNKK